MHPAASPSPGCVPGHLATITALARPADIRALTLPSLHLVMALRLTALFDAAGREPVAELAQRFRSVTAALAVLALDREIARTWPEPFVAHRPCCLAMSPDERTLNLLVRAAAGVDRDGFAQAIAGFVRADRHERLFAAAVEAVAALQQGRG